MHVRLGGNTDHPLDKFRTWSIIASHDMQQLRMQYNSPFCLDYTYIRFERIRFECMCIVFVCAQAWALAA